MEIFETFFYATLGIMAGLIFPGAIIAFISTLVALSGGHNHNDD